MSLLRQADETAVAWVAPAGDIGETAPLRATAQLLGRRAAARLVELRAVIGSEPTPSGLAALVGITAHGFDRELPIDDRATQQLGELLGLARHQLEAVVCLACVELDPHLRQLADEIAGGPNGRLLAELVYGNRSAELVADLSPGSPLLELALVDLAGAGGLLRRTITIAPRVLAWLLGDRYLDPSARARPVTGEELSIPPELERAMETGLTPVLVGPQGAGKTSFAACAARNAGRIAIASDASELDAAAVRVVAREARLLDAVLVVENADALWEGDRDRLRELERTTAALVLTSTQTSFRPIGFARGTQRFEMDVPSPQERAALWRRHLGHLVPDVERYRVTPGTIVRAAAMTERPPTLAGVHAAVRAQVEDKLATVATRITTTATFDDLILPRDTEDGLVELIARVRYRSVVLDDWGLASTLGPRLGVSALFAGDPGTGKSMAAGIIANELGLDLYQIDLSRIVSKWIGETEKNLANAFDAAESGHALLLFDEADSLFSKRTEVKSSTDRYANLEVNFLLTRLERFHGVAILTTNLDTAIDPAFRRRVTVRLAFPFPDENERERLWRSLVPRGVDADLGELARAFEMSGAYIKRAVERAAYLAAADGGCALTANYLHTAARLEYGELGKLVS